MPDPSLDAMPFDALLSVAILTIRSSPKSRAIDCMSIPTPAPLTLPTIELVPVVQLFGIGCNALRSHSPNPNL